MVNVRRGLCAIVALMLGLVLAACDTAAEDPGFAGHWSSPQWGEHYIIVDGSTMKIIYDHDDGRAVGVLEGNTFKGWWTEVPSRQPSRDAGDVIFTLRRSGETRNVDGEWRYGTEGALRQNWDLTWVGAEIPADVRAKFDAAATFVPHP